MASIRVPSTVPTFAHDCTYLRDVFTGTRRDERRDSVGTEIINILAHRNAQQRKAIRGFYTNLYSGTDLMKELEAKISGDFLIAMQVWMLDPVQRDVFLFHQCTRGSICHNSIIMEIACTRSSYHLLMIRQAYQNQFRRSLEEDVAENTRGDIRKLLVPLVTAFRFKGKDVNLNLAKSEARILYETVSNKAYNDDEIIRILTTRSKAQINATLNQYNNLYENSNNVNFVSKANGNYINKGLKDDDPNNEYLKLLRSTIKCLTFPPKYFEKVLRLTVKKHDTDKLALNRVVISRAEVDLKLIKQEYLNRNGVTLDNAILADTCGDYQRFLLALFGDEFY